MNNYNNIFEGSNFLKQVSADLAGVNNQRAMHQ